MIAVIDYGAGNLYSIAKALTKVGASDVLITSDPRIIKEAERLILPGVGAFGHCMDVLKKSGLVGVIEEEVVSKKKKPLLAICVGLQLMATYGYEHGMRNGLGWLNAEVVSLAENIPADLHLRIPHTGWDQVFFTKDSPLFEGILDGSSFYFNHSYFLRFLGKEDLTAARGTYGVEFTAAIQRENIFACQFHPEKSQHNGLRMLKNFCSWRPI